MERERKEALKWFVDFANMDLNQLKPGDKAKLLVEAEEYLFLYQEDLEKMLKFAHPGLYDKDDGPHGLTSLSEQMSWAFQKFAKDSNEYWAMIIRAQAKIQREFSLLCGLGKKPERTWILGIGDFFFRMEIEGGKYSHYLFPITPSYETYIEQKVYFLLNGLPQTTLQRCPGCETFFLNTRLREKRFCSPKCMWKINAERRREELKKHPRKYRAYLKKQKEIMRRRYEEKRKAELGPNVKIGRRKEG